MPISTVRWAVISAVGPKKGLECACPKQTEASFLPSFSAPSMSFHSVVLTVLENDAAKGKTSETTHYKLSQAMIQNGLYGTDQYTASKPKDYSLRRQCSVIGSISFNMYSQPLSLFFLLLGQT